jgi:hypothetical protein
MARTVSSVVFLPAQQPFWINRWYALASDSTLWSFSVRDGANWQKAPAIPGGLTVTAISVESSNQSPFLDRVYACLSDGSVWSAVITTPFVWTQVTSLPQT